MTPEARAKIQELADNLQVPLYIRADGKIYQHPPGEAVRPNPKRGPNLNHGAPLPTEKPPE